MRYRLRTLLIAVVIVAFPLAWVGSQYRIVTARRAIRAALEETDRPTATFHYGEPGEACERYIEGDAGRRPSRLRLWLGDEQVDSILFDAVGAPKRAVIEAFPEADIYFWDFGVAMLRYKLRTLLIVLALGPPVLAGGYWKAEQHHRRQEIKRLVLGLQNYSGDSLWRDRPPLPPVVWAKPVASQRP